MLSACAARAALAQQGLAACCCSGLWQRQQHAAFIHTSPPTPQQEEPQDTAGAGGSPAQASGKGSPDGAAQQAAGPSGRLPHIPLDHPDVNRYLRYNTEFKTDEQRAYKVGMLQAVQRTQDEGFQRMLSAHRLELLDAQLAAGRPPAPLQDQMAERLAQMEAAMQAAGGSRR